MNEEKYLEETISLINRLYLKNSEKVQNTIETLSHIKSYVWDNLSDLDPTEIQFMKNELEREMDLGNFSAVKNHVLNKMKLDPYFGRIDFKTEDTEKVYIGLSSIMDEKFNIYVYDWRSPICSMYYDYEVGDASYEAPIGTISGEITLKRQYKIINGKLDFYLDSDVNIDDEILLETLQNNNTSHMKNIVTTIQKEQNQVIRNDSNKVLIVEGPAGCGKTSVALHHIAYLLYKNKETLKSSNILIFSPNKIFSEYISHVLPELGEKNAIHTEFSSFINSFLNEYDRVESYSNFIKRIYKNKNINDSIKIKLDDNYHLVIDKYVDKLIKDIKFSNIYVGTRFLMSKDKVMMRFREDLKKYPVLVSLKRLKDYLVNEFNHSSVKRVNQLLLDRIIRGYLPNYNNAKKLLINMYRDDEIRSLLKEMYNVNDNFFSVSIENLKKDYIRYEDAIILAYLKGILGGYNYNKDIKYVVIDEAQDYTNMQYLILKNIFKGVSFTILGDSNQAVNPLFNYKSLNSLLSIFDDKSVLYNLKNTYRSTYEITEYANKIIGLDHVNSVNRHGDIVKTYDSIDCIENIILENNKYSQTAIIVYDDVMVEDVLSKLEVMGIKASKYSDKTIHDKLVIIPVYYAKGLEFESVIVIDKDMTEKISYVACTRALHKLDVIKLK